VAVAWVAVDPSLFVFVERGEELEALSDGPLPAFEVDRSRELPDRIGGEVTFGSGVKNVVRVCWLVAPAITGRSGRAIS